MRVCAGALLCAVPDLLCIAYAHAHEAQHVLTSPAQHPHLPRPRVAIVGGGAGGTSAAFFLRHLSDHEPSLSVDVDLFEINEYLGGRSNTIRPFHNEAYPAVEIGASIFVPANKNLWKAASVFNLTLQDGHGGDEEDARGVTIWNGEKFVFSESTWAGGFFDSLKLIWKYGFSPLTVRNTVKATVDKFVQLYSKEKQALGPHETLKGFAKSLDLDGMAKQSTKSFLKSASVSEPFINDLVGAATRVNYAQDPSTMQAFQGAVSMAGAGASSVVGGNKCLFSSFAKQSGATIHLNTQVMSIEELELDDMHERQPTWLLRYQDIMGGQVTTRAYDAIIYAAPIHPPPASTDPRTDFIKTAIPDLVPDLPYIQLHVTIVVTNATNPKSAFFGVKEKAPATILATFEPFLSDTSKTRPKINSLNYLRKLGKIDQAEGESHVIKIFSERELDSKALQEIFGSNEVIWVYRKLWASYPVAPPFLPNETLPAFKPDNSSLFYYVSAMEKWVSTMETQTVSAWNVVSLLVRDVFGYQVKQSWAEWDDM